jgi:hypothetical protein
MSDLELGTANGPTTGPSLDSPIAAARGSGLDLGFGRSPTGLATDGLGRLLSGEGGNAGAAAGRTDGGRAQEGRGIDLVWLLVALGAVTAVAAAGIVVRRVLARRSVVGADSEGAPLQHLS